MNDSPINRIAFHFLGSAVHGGDRLDWILPGRGFSRQHDGVRPLEDGRRNVRDLGASRDRTRDHGFEHLSRDDDWLTGAAGHARHLLLQPGHLFDRHFDAKVAARHHQCIDEIQDLAEAIDCLRLLNLGHDGGPATRDLLGLCDIVGPLDEGERNPVDTGIEARFQIRAVLCRHRRERHRGIGHADAFAVGQFSADLDPRENAMAVRLNDDEP